MSLPPPPPSPSPSPPHGFHFPVLAIALIGIVTTAILLISYYIFVIKCCLNLHRSDVINRLFSRRRHHLSAAVTAAAASPTGLDAAVIRSIPVIKYRKSSAVGRRKNADDNENDNDNDNNKESEIECAVCLSEFQDGEKLRVIPNCCHGFHIDCIDIWLQTSDNCPLCRSAISATSMLYNADNIKNFNNDNFSGDEDDYLVIEIQGNNNLISNSNQLRVHEKSKRIKSNHVCSIGDELIDSMRKKDEEFEIQPIRRSISMDLSSNTEFCIDVQDYCRRSKNNNGEIIEVNEVNNSNSCSNNSKIRRSMFSFGYGSRSTRCSVQPVHQLDS
ncbi:RING-H2 finger protein ATL16-like [Silene latifolia]|uniref:RING-H2 finger protein ATL16-like n=1 Tax=Silene latifolia TaxID=37657 RepID=UPI003D776EBF